MEPGSSTGDVPPPPNHRWANILGTFIALITLTLPLLVVAIFSSSSSLEHLQRSANNARLHSDLSK